MGCHRDDLDEIDGALHRAVRCLRAGVETERLRSFHTEYDSPLIVYAENLVYSTLDYGYTERALPALVGFDILPYTDLETMTPPGNPYEETFEGFLPLTDAWEIFEGIQTGVAPVEHTFVPATILAEPAAVDPERYAVPSSSLNDGVRAEGVVVRSDSHARRVKVVHDAFKELNREQFGQQPDEAESGAEYLVARYCTAARIRKEVRTMVVEEGHDFGRHLTNDLYPRVVEDIWAESWPEIMQLDVSITPADVYPLVAKRCVTELEQMETNTELNDADPTTIWQHLR